MAKDTLSTALVIEDRASSVLESIARQAEMAAQAIQNVSRAAGALNNTAATVQSARGATSTSTEPTRAATVARAVDSATDAAEKAVTRVYKTTQATTKAVKATRDATQSAITLVRAAQGTATAGTNAAARGSSAFSRLSERFSAFMASSNPTFARIRGALDNFKNKFIAFLNQSANFAGLSMIIDGIKSAITSQFAHADKILNQQARFRMIAEQEGKTGKDVGTRADQLSNTNNDIARAVGMNKYAFADISSSFMIQGGGVFKDMEEAQVFAASLRQNFDLVGTEASEATNAMIQLKQALGSGRLQGDELRSVLENAPNVAHLIEREIEREQGLAFGEASGQIRKFASEGLVTSKTVKNAILRSAKETNAQWEKMPNTWSKLFSRFQTLKDNASEGLYKAFGRIADSKVVLGLATALINAFRTLYNIAQTLAPVFGFVFSFIASAITVILDTFSIFFENTTIGFITLAAGATALVLKFGLVTKAIYAARAAIIALSAHPLVAILVILMACTLQLVRLIRTNEKFNAAMLEVTAAMAYAYQQVKTFFQHIADTGEIMIAELINGFYSIKIGFYNLCLGFFRKLKSIDDAFRSTAIGKWILGKITGGPLFDDTIRGLEIALDEAKKVQEENESIIEEASKRIRDDVLHNREVYDEYKKNIPKYAKENVERNKQNELLDKSDWSDLLNEVTANMPGTGSNPAEVKGEVSIDTESFEILKRAASAEIVNRYTTLRPVVNARFGDVNNMTAADAQQLLIESIREAEGSSIASALAL